MPEEATPQTAAVPESVATALDGPLHPAPWRPKRRTRSAESVAPPWAANRVKQRSNWDVVIRGQIVGLLIADTTDPGGWDKYLTCYRGHKGDMPTDAKRATAAMEEHWISDVMGWGSQDDGYRRLPEWAGMPSSGRLIHHRLGRTLYEQALCAAASALGWDASTKSLSRPLGPSAVMPGRFLSLHPQHKASALWAKANPHPNAPAVLSLRDDAALVRIDSVAVATLSSTSGSLTVEEVQAVLDIAG